MYATLTIGLLLAATAAPVEAPAPALETTIDHAGRTLTVRYSVAPLVATRQIGHLAPNRANAAQCQWTASLRVQREVLSGGEPVAALTRQIDAGTAIEGSRPGACVGLRSAIARDAAAKLSGNERVTAAAEADRAKLAAELDGVTVR